MLLLFLDELCASIVRSHRETSQYRVEELQALRWKLFSREEIQAYQSKVCALFSLHFLFLFFNFAISPSCVRANSDSLKTKHVISHALCLRLVLFDESNRKLRKRLSSLPPPLLSLIFFSVDQRENSRVNWVIKYRNLSSRLNCWDTEDEFLWDEWNVLPFRAHFKQSMVKEKD